MCAFSWAHTRRCVRAGDATCTVVAAAASTTLSSRHVALRPQIHCILVLHPFPLFGFLLLTWDPSLHR